MLIRGYDPDDLEIVHTINQAQVPAVGSETIEALGHIGKQSVIALVAVDEDDDIGAFCKTLAPGADYKSGNFRWCGERYDDLVYLDRIAVAPQFQRRGVGGRM